MADVNITGNGKEVTRPAGALSIEACKSVGIEIPSFCYYPGLSLQGACRMCIVEIAKMPNLQTASTTFISEGMAVTTQSDTVKQARRAVLEFVPTWDFTRICRRHTHRFRRVLPFAKPGTPISPHNHGSIFCR